MKIRHLLFDNDGTIVDSEVLAVKNTLLLLREYGLNMSEQEYSVTFPGLLERDVVAILTREHNLSIPHDHFERLRQMHLDAFAKYLRAIPGMSSLFRSLTTPKSMVSNGSVHHVESCLRRVRLRHAVTGHIFSAEHVDNPKPFPDVYHHALQTLDLQPSETLVIEDSPTGVIAAKSAGLQVVGFLGAAHIHDGHDKKLQEAGADFLARDAAALRGVFAKLGVG